VAKKGGEFEDIRGGGSEGCLGAEGAGWGGSYTARLRKGTSDFRVDAWFGAKGNPRMNLREKGIKKQHA